MRRLRRMLAMWRGLVGVRFVGVGLCNMYGLKPEIANKTHPPHQ
jgi:hypothetical protein